MIPKHLSLLCLVVLLSGCQAKRFNQTKPRQTTASTKKQTSKSASKTKKPKTRQGANNKERPKKLVKNKVVARPRPVVVRQRPKPRPKPEPRVKTLTFAMVGDAMSHPRHNKSSYYKDCKCYRFEDTYRFIKPIIQKVDVAIANLETTLPGPKGGYTGFPFFGAPDAYSMALKRTGFDVLITANNHIYDKKVAGLVRTLEVLDKQGFQHVGAYRSSEENKKKRHIFIEKKGFKIALLAYTSHVNFYHSIKDLKPWHVNKLKWDDIYNDQRALNKLDDVDMVLASMHSWPEHKSQPHPYQLRRVKWLMHAGVDMVLGHHPHVLQPMETKKVKDQFGDTKDRFVAYSLGNFVSSMSSFYSTGSIILLFTLEKRKQDDGSWETRLSKVDYVPIWTLRQYNRKTRRWSYTVLPIDTFEDNDHDDVTIPKAIHRRMLSYRRFVHRHLRKGMRTIRASIQRSAADDDEEDEDEDEDEEEDEEDDD